MRTLKIELLRFGRDNAVVSDRYLVTIDGAPARTVEPSLGAEEILRTLNKLRYQGTLDGQHPTQDELDAIAVLRALVAEFFVDLPQLPNSTELTQIDLVTDKVELWALPFEFALAKDGRELLCDRDRPVLLTRRVRRSFAERAHPWPVKPRVLFAWAGDVQFEKHRASLQRALEPWIGPLDEGLVPNASPVLTELRNAKLAQIAEACGKAALEGKPYSHIHILAHGASVPDAMVQLQSFGVRFADGVARAESFVDALGAGKPNGPTVVTLAVCDSSNASNSIVAGGRVAYQLHAEGVPVVIGSQFPLTEEGAAIYAGVFYRRLLADATDVRVALCEARAALRSPTLPGHDWASITAHLSLPEGYLEQLDEQVQRMALEQLNSVNRWAQRIAERKEQVGDEIEARIERLLEERIEALKARVQRPGKRAEAIALEDKGLLASAYKRLAELVFYRLSPEATKRSRDMLAESGRWYFEAHDGNLSHHWTGTQHLAIIAATTGSIPFERTAHWYSSLHAAEREAKQPVNDANARSAVGWALGSLTELCLLRPYLAAPTVAGPTPAAALDRLLELASQDPVMQGVIDSTWRQLCRYVAWWNQANGFFPGAPDLAQAAMQLVHLLSPHLTRA